MSVKTLVASLSPAERAVTPHLKTGQTVRELAEKSNLQYVEAMRACQFLANKEVLRLDRKEADVYGLTEEGKNVLDNGLPEQRILKALDEPKSMQALQKEFSRNEVNASIGILKRAKAIEMGKEIKKLKEVDFSKKHAQLVAVAEEKDVKLDPELQQRGLVEKTTKATHVVHVTKTGAGLVKADLSEEYVERLTPDMLVSGSWKGAQFRHYDVTSPLPAKGHGRQHFVNEAIQAIKQIWIEMGFTECTGDMIQTAFWDLDALFVPQDHPAREMQDTFYMPNAGKLPACWKDVKAAHENGGKTGSKGWQYKYSEAEAKKLLLRTHDTVQSARTLKMMGEQGITEGKYFQIMKVFRNENLDWKHLFEFYQIGGIVIGKGLGLADLIGLQKEFYKRMGYTDIRFRPAYFPYTEPSAEVEVYNPHKKQWVELGGMGVFRPELVTTLLGHDIPVLAWGLGMERIITAYYDIKDLREIYKNDLEQMRDAKKYLEGLDANN